MSTAKRNIFHANPYERKILKTIFLFATVPVVIVILFFFALFNDLIYAYIGSGRAAHFLNRFLVLAGFLIFYYAVFTNMVFHFTNRLAGAYQRLLRELDEIISGADNKRLHLRKGDYGKELIERINRLMDRFT